MEVILIITYKQIEASREIRLWITQVIMPALALALVVPESREVIVTKAKEVKDKIKNRFQK